MRELKVNKKLKKKIVGLGYKNTHEWIQAKIKRIIFIDIFAAIPEVAALIALVDSLFSNDDDIILIVTGVWCSTALIPLCVEIIQAYHMRCIKKNNFFMMMKALHFLLQIMLVCRVIGHIKLSIKK